MQFRHHPGCQHRRRSSLLLQQSVLKDHVGGDHGAVAAVAAAATIAVDRSTARGCRYSPPLSL